MKRNVVMFFKFMMPAIMTGMIILVGCSPAGLEPEAAQPEQSQPTQMAAPSTVPSETEDVRPVQTVLPITIPAEPIAPTPVDETLPESGTPHVGDSEFSNGEVPEELFDAVLDDLLSRTNADRTNVEVIKSEAVTWPDGSIGCPQPGMMYTQALVEGYQVILGLEDHTYDYHLSDTGYFILCENSFPVKPGIEPPTK